ncbi:hypothetical protein RMCBS344292_19082 [Rhizopus microsporus]|nr:hypothetical protein RMCBS344292_19082 [Rhizopus microsporus]
MLRRVADHYPLIYRVSCFLETDDQVELFIRCLSLDRMTSAEEIKPSLFQFLNLLESDTRQCIERVLVEDPHGYLSVQDCTPSDGFLDLDRLSEVISDSVLFEQVMATIQSNAARGLPWIESVQQIYELVRDRGLWEQLAPILQQVITGKK